MRYFSQVLSYRRRRADIYIGLIHRLDSSEGRFDAKFAFANLQGIPKHFNDAVQPLQQYRNISAI